uniref:HAT C-terminal dimerisation domain-containing protein n=1 Tax=Sphaeramia orbicularis TaxID=375764 RepID=A0A672Z5U1_9TELE
MSRQPNLLSYFKKTSRCDGIKRGEKRGTDAMEDAIAMTIISATDDCIANSKYVGIIVDESINIVVEKMLVIYLTLKQNGKSETVFLGNFVIPSGTAECITAKIKDVDGASVMLGRKDGVAQQLRQNDCPYLMNIHCGVRRMVLAARNASKERDLLSLKQQSATCWVSLERVIKGVRTNWAALVLELVEEEAIRGCPVTKGIRKQLQMYMFPALTHFLTDVLAMVNYDLMNEPGEAERKFLDTLQDGKFCGITLKQADAQIFSVLHTEFPLEHVGIIADLNTVLNDSGHPTVESALKSYGMEVLEQVCEHYSAQTGAVEPLVQKERMVQNFLSVKRVPAGSGNPTFRESCRLLDTSLGDMFPDFKTLAEVVLVIPVSSVAAERGFSLQNQIKTAMRCHLSEAKVQNLKTVASAPPFAHPLYVTCTSSHSLPC